MCRINHFGVNPSRSRSRGGPAEGCPSNVLKGNNVRASYLYDCFGERRRYTQIKRCTQFNEILLDRLQVTTFDDDNNITLSARGGVITSCRVGRL